MRRMKNWELLTKKIISQSEVVFPKKKENILYKTWILSLSFLNTQTLKWTLTLYAWLLRLNNALIIIPLVWPNYDAAAAQFSSSKIKQKNIHSNVGWWWRRRRWKFYLTLFESYNFSCSNNLELHVFTETDLVTNTTKF